LSTPGSGTATASSAWQLGERALIERIRARLGAPPADLIVGIGDDAAVAAPVRGALEVLTTDALVEGVHFDPAYSSYEDVGFKAIAVNASDVAAMGGTPRLALLSLVLPERLSLADVDALMDGVAAAAADAGVAVAGGNLARSPRHHGREGILVVDVTLTGWVHPRKMLTRSAGKPGDALYVSGTIGAAAAGLDWLSTHRGGRREPDDPEIAACVERHRRPAARVRLGKLLGRNGAATTCMDLSDGLADAVTQVATASGTGAVIDADVLPIHPGATRWFTARGLDPLTAALSGGDDYELLVGVPVKRRGRLKHVLHQSRGVTLTRIGELTKDPGIGLTRNGRLERLPPGFVQF
jgi:thiamine-monophosphate kinase